MLSAQLASIRRCRIYQEEYLEFEAGEVAVPAGSRLFIYSDGAFEIVRSDGSMWPFAEFVAKLAREDGAAATSPPAGRMDALLDHIRQISGRGDFNDDFSMIGMAID